MSLRTLTHQEMWGIDMLEAADIDVTGPQVMSTPQPATNVICPTASCFWADPFAVDNTTVVAEELDFSGGVGNLVAIDLERSEPPRTILADGVHSSYPFVLHHDDETLIVPERATTERLEYYRYHHDRPLELVHIALPGRRLVDPTIVEHEGHWYLFAVDGRVDISSTLELYISDSPLGPWEPHPASPIVVDRRRARPAGAILSIDNVLWRPAQDCGDTYGGSVRLQRIEQLDPDRYSENDGPVIVSPVPDRPAGCHTLNRFPDGRWLIDTKSERLAIGNRHVAASKLRLLTRRLT